MCTQNFLTHSGSENPTASLASRLCGVPVAVLPELGRGAQDRRSHVTCNDVMY